MKKIICFHLYNDYSGSPKVLSLVICGLVKKGYTIELYTSQTDGFLSDIEGVTYHTFNYKWTKNKIITLLALLYAQLYIFLSTMKYRNEKDILFYVNTICPFGAVLSAALWHIPILYHVHEKYVKPNFLHRFYERIWLKFSVRTLFVSEYLKDQYPQTNKQSIVVYNALSDEFLSHVKVREHTSTPYHVLMISSLKSYKGIHTFVALAGRLPQYQFSLVVNCSLNDINSCFSKIPTNLQIYPAQQTVYDFLHNADLVLNLSVPSLWVETFGLTLLEAMAYGLPVICPPIGGPVELVENDYNGFLVDSRDIEQVIEKIIYIFESGQYERLSANAKIKSLLFDYTDMVNKISEQIKKM